MLWTDLRGSKLSAISKYPPQTLCYSRPLREESQTQSENCQTLSYVHVYYTHAVIHTYGSRVLERYIYSQYTTMYLTKTHQNSPEKQVLKNRSNMDQTIYSILVNHSMVGPFPRVHTAHFLSHIKLIARLHIAQKKPTTSPAIATSSTDIRRTLVHMQRKVSHVFLFETCIL